MTDNRDRAAVSEADAQSEETIMPWIWGLIGLVVIAVFVAWIIFGAPAQPHPPAGGGRAADQADLAALLRLAGRRCAERMGQRGEAAS